MEAAIMILFAQLKGNIKLYFSIHEKESNEDDNNSININPIQLDPKGSE